jgi:hypothetical protein
LNIELKTLSEEERLAKVLISLCISTTAYRATFDVFPPYSVISVYGFNTQIRERVFLKQEVKRS